MQAPSPANEPERLQALDRCQLLDSPPEDFYDRLTRVAAQLFATPIAAISLVAKDRQYFKSILGLELRETGREVSFCAHAILQDKPLVVLDASLDSRFRDNSLVTGTPGIRFYCGAPFRTPDGLPLGALCVIDTEPHTEAPATLVRLLEDLAAQASTEIANRQQSLRLATTSSALQVRELELEQEKQLRNESEVRANLALEAGNMGSWEWNPASGLFLCSPLMRALFGYSATEILPSRFRWIKRVHPEDRQTLITVLRSGAADKGRAFALRFRLMASAGEWRWLALKGRSRLLDGAEPGAHGVCWDVTDRIKAEEKLRASEEIFSGISASSPVGIFRSDLDGNISYMNPRGLEIWKMNEAEIAGAGWARHVHPQDIGFQLEAVAQANNEARAYETECRLLLPGNAVRWLHVRSRIVADRNGTPVGRVGTVDDITDRKRLDEERHASQEMTRRILESSADCIKVLDLKGGLVSMSPGGQRALGITDLPALIGVEYISLWKQESDREAAKAAFRLAAAGGIGSFQGFFPGATGELRWWDTVFSPMFDQAGNPDRILAVSRDLTDFHRATIEQQRARELAEEANRSKSLFLANVSHELRTPLNGVLGMTALLLDSDLTEEQWEQAVMVKQSGSALLSLVNDLLDLTRVEAGKLDCARTSFNLRSTVRQACALVAPIAQQKSLALNIDYPESLPDRIMGDEDRIRQIVLNYLHNALKFTDIGEVTVEVRAEPADDPSSFTIAVRDTGKGVPRESQAHLFTAFEQVDASSTRKHGGIGLGLALSKRIAETMGGSVGLVSAPGQGSTFWVKLPFLNDQERCAESSLETRDRLRASAATEAPRVLVAEDNLINQKVVIQFLKKLGWRSDLAADGLAALRLFEQNTYDVVLMDCQMPELDGYETAGRMRRLESSRQQKPTPIVALTAHAMVGDRERCLQAGMDDHLSKPLSMQSLKDTLAKWHAVSTVCQP